MCLFLRLAWGVSYLLQGIRQGGFAPGARLLPAQNHIGLSDLTGMDVGRGRRDGHNIWNQSRPGYRWVGPQRPLISASHSTGEGTWAQRDAGTCSRSPSKARQSWCESLGPSDTSPRLFPTGHLFHEGQSQTPLTGPSRTLTPCTLNTDASVLCRPMSQSSRTLKELSWKAMFEMVTCTFKIVHADCDLAAQVKGDL
jgi:hypothetical protein